MLFFLFPSLFSFPSRLEHRLSVFLSLSMRSVSSTDRCAPRTSQPRRYRSRLSRCILICLPNERRLMRDGSASCVRYVLKCLLNGNARIKWRFIVIGSPLSLPLLGSHPCRWCWQLWNVDAVQQCSIRSVARCLFHYKDRFLRRMLVENSLR